MSTTHALYRFFDETGQLLYVGISVDPGRRFAQHRSDKPWWGDVVSITVQPMPSRRDALLAEMEAIKNERPLYNSVYNQTRDTDGEIAFLMCVLDDHVLSEVVRVLGGDQHDVRLASNCLWTVAQAQSTAFKSAVAAGEDPDDGAMATAMAAAVATAAPFLHRILNRARSANASQE